MKWQVWNDLQNTRKKWNGLRNKILYWLFLKSYYTHFFPGANWVSCVVTLDVFVKLLLAFNIKILHEKRNNSSVKHSVAFGKYRNE